MHYCHSESGHDVIDEVCFPVVLGQPGQDGQEGEKEGFPVEFLAGKSAKVFDEAVRGGGLGRHPGVPGIPITGG